MLSRENESFLAYWEKNGESQRTSTRPLLVGLSAGIAIGVGVLVVLETGWFERANMVANSRLSSVVLVLAIMILSLFMAFFYRRFRWEMMEQRYQELKAAQKRLEKESQSSHNV
jgi:membrane protein YdbS with pleckstrin-like domain